MQELGMAVGLMLVLEGALYALFADRMHAVAIQMENIPAAVIRIFGLSILACGWVIVWLLKS
ncbi:MAG: DUF2065 domain-containing protein [Mariprofundales bacterium]